MTEQYDAGGISATQSFGRDLKKCLELKRVYLHEDYIRYYNTRRISLKFNGLSPVE
ncbi:IS3 family transposase [Salmonella enterica subsp. enterica serovar Senftenberg]|nr:IS3 family transposase [Salmonella enterica subsp. enterica serovar Senftenberg]EHS1350502.1 IS3 family transposase [Salmonella enterica subsp. enterica serovar Senftenberg]